MTSNKLKDLLICLLIIFKTEDIHPEAPKEKNGGYAEKDDLLPSDKKLKPEVSPPDTEHRNEHQNTRKQGRTGSEHQVKNSLKNIDFLVPHNRPGLASDDQNSDSGSSSREQSGSEHYQFRRHEKHSNTTNRHVLDNTENPVDDVSLDHEHNMQKDNENTVGLSEKISESYEEGVEEEDEEWDEETGYRDMMHKDHQTNQDNQYKRQQNENSMQSDEILRDSSQPIQITKRHGEKFDLEEEEREHNQKKPYKEEIPLFQKTHDKDEDDKQQSQERKDNTQVNYQSHHDTVVKRQGTEDSNVDDDGHDSADVDGKEDSSNTWKEASYEEEERIQSNDQESTSIEHEGEGTIEDDTAILRETEDYQDVKNKDLIHSEQDNYNPEALNSDREQQLETRSMNSTESEDKVNSLK